MDNLISGLRDVGGGGIFRSSGMRVEDAEQVEFVIVDPLKRIELFGRIHHESHGTLSLILHEKHLLDPVIFPRQQAARFQWYLAADMPYDFINLIPG